MVDGSVAANNPTILAMSEISKQILLKNDAFPQIKPLDYAKFLVISLRTRPVKEEEKYTAHGASTWGAFGWLFKDGSTPLIDIFMQASADLVDIQAATPFQVLQSDETYLCIQDDTLTGTTSSIDISTEDNLLKLVDVGKELLKKTVSRVDIETGHYVPVEGGGTNEEALTRFAKILSEERQSRMARKLTRYL